ncbi:MAG: hypothetical protein DDT25_01074 [Chloroflexi bacterium]|nr:hypothetical protein [Chloroflexota bacterium]
MTGFSGLSLNYSSHSIRETKQGKEIILTGEIDKTFKIIHRFSISNEPYFEERITLSKEIAAPVDISYLGLGFTKKLANNKYEMANDVRNYHMVAIPCRRNVKGNVTTHKEIE